MVVAAGVTYEYYSDGKLVISGNGSINGYSTSSLPWPNVKELIIEEGITKLGYQSFIKCTSLTSISLPSTLQSTDQSTFSGCTNIKDVYIKDLTSFLNIAWAYNAAPRVNNGNLYIEGELVTDLVIPDGITSIGQEEFRNFISFESVTIPGSVSSIGSEAFAGCDALESVKLPGSITKLDSKVFSECESLKYIKIPDNVTSIGYGAFERCYALERVEIPDNLTTMGSSVFDACTSLANIEIPGSVTTIGSNAFDYCTSLESVTLKNGTTTIGQYAFRNCTNLSKIIIPKSVTGVEYNAFGKCDNLGVVYYEGMKEEWELISVKDSNEKLTAANIHYECDGKYTSVITKPTCEENGYTTHTCTCGKDSYNDHTESLLGHSFTEYVRNNDATCMKNGTETAFCDRKCCEEDTRIIENSTVKHSFTNYMVHREATCTSQGEEIASCDYGCTETDSRAIKMLEHPYGEWTIDTEASCNAVGSKHKTCAVCGDVLTEEIPVAGHSWNSEYTVDEPADCEKPGSKSVHCKNCTATKDSEIIEAAGHKEEVIPEVLPSCTKEGMTEGSYCIICKETLVEQEVVGVLEHTGMEDGVCDVCGTEVEKPNLKPDVSEVFPDVPSNAWYKAAVQYVFDKELMFGSNGLFLPNKEINRAQFVTTLYRLEGEPEITNFDALEDFSDVKEKEYYTAAVCWAYTNGITTGNDGKFNTYNSLSRQQLATFLYRFAKYKELDVSVKGDYSSMPGAKDVQEYAKEAMEWAVGTGILSGSGANKELKPAGYATRAQLATILQRFCDNHNL